MNTIFTCVRNLCCYRPPLSKMDHEIEMTKHELTKSTFSNTTPFVPQLNCGKVIKVYDGNTIIIAAKNPQPDAAVVRFIADIYLDDIHVNQWMLDHHYVDKYTGGKQ